MLALGLGFGVGCWPLRWLWDRGEGFKSHFLRGGGLAAALLFVTPAMEAAISHDFTAAMDRALEEARLALAHDDVPIGAVLLDDGGAVVAADHNRREQHGDATAHAELLVLSAASRALGDWRLNGHTLVVTLEPCAMCAMAAVWARLDRIVYATADLKAGAAWSLYNIPQDERLNHRCEVVAGIREAESKRLLGQFFASRR
jgi:tRNA(adenine34) deaminase